MDWYNSLENKTLNEIVELFEIEKYRQVILLFSGKKWLIYDLINGKMKRGKL